MSKKISEMTPASTLNTDDIIPIVDTGYNNKTASVGLIRGFILGNASNNYNTFTDESSLMNWLLTMCTTMHDNDVQIVAFKPNFSSSFFGGANQTGIVYRISNGVYRVAFPNICGDAYYYSSAWHFTKFMTTDSIIVDIKNATIPSVGAGSTGSTSVSVTKTGYTPLGIISITGSGSTGLAYSDWYINSTGTAYIYYKNDTTSAKSNVTLGLTILYKKN